MIWNSRSIYLFRTWLFKVGLACGIIHDVRQELVMFPVCRYTHNRTKGLNSLMIVFIDRISDLQKTMTGAIIIARARQRKRCAWKVSTILVAYQAELHDLPSPTDFGAQGLTVWLFSHWTSGLLSKFHLWNEQKMILFLGWVSRGKNSTWRLHVEELKDLNDDWRYSPYGIVSSKEFSFSSGL